MKSKDLTIEGDLAELRPLIALAFMHSFIGGPLFSEQCNESTEDDHMRNLAERTAVDAFALADAFLAAANQTAP